MAKAGSLKIFRFIPTCVGNAILAPHSGTSISVHPHVCGERFSACFTISSINGSSPRVWGTLDESLNRELKTRFIPTCVGNAVGVYYVIRHDSVHPHVCGERMN